MYGPGPAGRPTEVPSAGTAKTLVLIGLIIQAIGAVITAVLTLLLLVILPPAGVVLLAALPVVLLGVVVVVTAVLLYCGYEYCYRRTARGDYEGARTPTLVLGIVGLFIGGIITGILYLVAYAKLGEAISERNAYRAGSYYAPPYATAPGYPGPPGAPAYPGYSSPPPAPPNVTLCPQCHRPASYLVQYSRFYCYPCARYV